MQGSKFFIKDTEAAKEVSNPITIPAICINCTDDNWCISV